MLFLLPAAFFVLGTIVASFIGVLAVRLNTGQSFLAGRSSCDACTTPLSPRSLMPIISFLMSGGRALCCGARLSPFAPLAEFLLGGLFTGAYLKYGLTIALLPIFFSFAALLALVFYDLMHHILPPWLLLIFVLASGAASFFSAPSRTAFSNSFFIAVSIAAGFALIHFLSRGRALGFADAPLALGLSLLVGSELSLSGLVFSFWIGAAVGIVLLLRRPRGSRISSEVPFAPFLAIGFLLAYFTQWNLFAFAAGLP